MAAIIVVNEAALPTDCLPPPPLKLLHTDTAPAFQQERTVPYNYTLPTALDDEPGVSGEVGKSLATY